MVFVSVSHFINTYFWILKNTNKFITNHNNRGKTIADTHFGLILCTRKKTHENRNQRTVSECVGAHTHTRWPSKLVHYLWECFGVVAIFERRLLFFVLINGLVKQVKWCDSLWKQCERMCVLLKVSAPLHTTLNKNERKKERTMVISN